MQLVSQDFYCRYLFRQWAGAQERLYFAEHGTTRLPRVPCQREAPRLVSLVSTPLPSSWICLRTDLYSARNSVF
jgi:hypothetical protein